MKMFKLIQKTFVLFLIFSISCGFCNKSDKEKNGNSSEPVYVPDIVWTLETNALEPWADMKLIDGYLYLIESNYLYADENNPNWCQLTKVDPSTGTYAWMSEIIQLPEKTHAVKCMGRVFIQVNPGYLMCFDDNNGNLLATVKLGIDDNASIRNATTLQYLLSYNDHLFWGNFGYDFSGGVDPLGLMRFDINDIDFLTEPKTEQIIPPELVWEAPTSHPVWAAPIENNGIIYFITKNPPYDYLIGEGSNDLVALDALTCDVLWKLSQYMVAGICENNLIINNDYLYLVDSSLGCYNKYTGEKYYEIISREVDYTKEYSLVNSSFSRGIFFNDNKLYYTSQAYSGSSSITGIPPELVKNIKCVNATNGKFVWGDLTDGGSLGTRPIVVNGKAYVVTDCGLRVYDAETGKLIGVDRTVMNLGQQPNALYNDFVIYLNDNFENRTATLTAIRAY